MPELCGWLLDVYPHTQEGVALWLLCEDGQRRSLRLDLPVWFYIAGAPAELRAVWRYLQAQPLDLRLERQERRELFSGPIPVLAVRCPGPLAQQRLYHGLRQHFPALEYYDADLPAALHCAGRYDVFPLARCQVQVDEQGRVQELQALDSPWELDPHYPPLRILHLRPDQDQDPAHCTPSALEARCGRYDCRLALQPGRALLNNLSALLRRLDPDLIVAPWGDSWLFPRLMALSRRLELPFNPNRDPARLPLYRPGRTCFTYGQPVHRGEKVLLFGRWHIDPLNAVLYAESGLEGILEQARVTGLPVQETARRSPGAGITALHIQEALRQEILVPCGRQKAERYKSLPDLVRLDQGGLVYQPPPGLHRDVAEIDFVSMYPSMLVNFNLSPETVRPSPTPSGDAFDPGLVVDERPGFVSQSLRPLLEKRIALKARLGELSPHDCRYAGYKGRSAALKWLLVVCFGYMGYQNARFGRIESHQAICAFGREALLRAKEAAEDLGYTVLHMYVDGLWVQQPGHTSREALQPLLDEIARRSGLPIALDGVYRWVAFLNSRVDSRIPVANRYFGTFQDGSLKLRGIDARRHDTAPFVASAQLELLELLARAPDLEAARASLPQALLLLRRRMAQLCPGQGVLPQALLVRQRLSRELQAYRSPSPAARAALQLQQVGKTVAVGQSVRFVYTLGRPGVHAWDLPEPPVPASLDYPRYRELLLRAAAAVLEPFGLPEARLRRAMAGGGEPLALPLPLRAPAAWPRELWAGVF